MKEGVNIVREDGPVESRNVDVGIIGVYSDGMTDTASRIDRVSGGVIQQLLDSREFRAESGQTLTLHCLANVTPPIIQLAGLGARNQLDRGEMYRTGGAAVRAVTDRPRERLAVAMESEWSSELQTALIAGMLVGAQNGSLYKTESARAAPLQLVSVGGNSSAIDTGRVVGQAINWTRRMVNEPASVIFPESFVDRFQQSIEDVDNITTEVWDENQLRDQRCGALLGVAQGSARPPRLLIMQYAQGRPDQPWCAMVGKGVTFDSGGLSLKPSSNMLSMKADMAGAATVAGAMQAIARLELPVNVMGIVGLVENMPSARAYKLGDVLTTRNGRTIEVHNTDAEGRLVLADALSVAVDRKADRIVDLATLTGACVVALGNNVTGAMTNDQTWCDQVIAAAQRAGEPIWQLPMFAEYGEMIKGTVADIKNVGEGRFGGAMTAAKLLEHFVGGKPWVHLDIAGPAFSDKPKSWVDSGATGIMVRTLIELAGKNSVLRESCEGSRGRIGR